MAKPAEFVTDPSEFFDGPSKPPRALNNQNIVKGSRARFLAMVGLGSLIGFGGVQAFKSTTGDVSAPFAIETSDGANETLVVASAPEAALFASLNSSVQDGIRAEFSACLAEAEAFANEETNPDDRAFELEDGMGDCEQMREFGIRRAVADDNIRNTTNSITGRG